MPYLAKKCIESWHRYCPDYTIVRWDESSFNVDSHRFTAEAHRRMKWAFVTDYVRLHALLKHGGIYMDTDVELIKSIDHFLDHKAFSGCESPNHCVTGIIGSEANHPWISRLISYYNNRGFITPSGEEDLTPNTNIITDITKQDFRWVPGKSKLQILEEGITIYPAHTFCPKDWITRKIALSNDTYTIHHFSGSWKKQPFAQLRDLLIRVFGPIHGDIFYSRLILVTIRAPKRFLRRLKRMAKSIS